MPVPYAAVFLDLDGTLIDSEPLHCEAHRRFLSSQGLNVSDEVIYGNIGKGDRAFYRDLMARHGIPGDPQEWMRAKTGILMDIYRYEGVSLMPGVGLFLDHAESLGVPCGVVTSSERPLAVLALEVTRLAPRLPLLAAHEDTVAHKPNPEPYLLAAERLGVAIGHCLVVEDSPNGVAAGCAAGATTVAMAGMISEAELRAAGAGRCLRRLDELIPLTGLPTTLTQPSIG
jgi:HAD superfamily hydrolase (TIGR01509 family)